MADDWNLNLRARLDHFYPVIMAGIKGLIESGWLVCLIVVPLYFNGYSKRIFEPDKQGLFRWIVSLMLAAGLIYVISNFNSRKKDFRTWIRQTFLKPSNALILVVLLSYILSSVFSISPEISLRGSYMRSQGLITLLSCVFLFLLVREFLRTPEQWKRVIFVVILTSVPISLYGIIQFLGFDPVAWGKIVQGGFSIRISSTMGNPIFLGAYCLFPIFIILGWLVFESCPSLSKAARMGLPASSNNPLRILLALVLILNLTCLFLSASRGPLLGLFWGCVVFLLGSWTRNPVGKLRFFSRPSSRTAASFLVFVLVLAAVFGILSPLRGNPDGISANPFDRLISKTVIVRLLLWQNAIDVISSGSAIESVEGEEDKPSFLRKWLGFGPETFLLTSPRKYPEYMGYYEHPRGRADRAHNVMLDALVNRGILGLFSEILIFSLVFWIGLRVLNRFSNSGQVYSYFITTAAYIGIGASAALVLDPRLIGLAISLGLLVPFLFQLCLPAGKSHPVVGDLNPLFQQGIAVGLLSALTAHFFELQSGFTTAATQVYFWFFAAALFAYSESKSEIEEFPEGESKNRQNDRKEILVAVLFIVTGATVFSYDFSGNWGREDSLFTSLAQGLPGLAGFFDLSIIPDLFIVLILFCVWGIVFAYLFFARLESPGSWGRKARRIGVAGLFCAGSVYLMVSIFTFLGKHSNSNIALNQGIARLHEAPLFVVFWLLLTGLIIITAFLIHYPVKSRYDSRGFRAFFTALLVIPLLAVIWRTETVEIQKDVILKQAEFTADLGRFDLSFECFNRMGQISKLNHTDLQSRAGILVRNAELIGNQAERELLYERAQSDLKMALNQQPYDPTPLEGLSQLYTSWGDRTQSIEERTKKYHQALDQIELAIKLSPGLGYLYHRKGNLLVRMGHFEEAVNILQAAISLDPDYLPGYQSLGDLIYLLAEIEREKRQYEKALDYYRKALDVFSAATDIRPDFEKGIRAREEILDRMKDQGSNTDP